MTKFAIASVYLLIEEILREDQDQENMITAHDTQFLTICTFYAFFSKYSMVRLLSIGIPTFRCKGYSNTLPVFT